MSGCKKLTIFFIFFITVIILKSNMALSGMSTEVPQKTSIRIVLSEQKLYLLENDVIIKEYDISSSKYGIGNEAGSNKTPLGIHKIASKFGKDAKTNTIFKSRRNTGRTADINYTKKSSGDFITSRILWLAGLEDGVNKGDGVDSYLRHIYIHGTPDEGLIGTPASHGCIRMRNSDVIELFDLTPIGTIVDIRAE